MEEACCFQENPQPTTYTMNFEAQNAACHELFINSFAMNSLAGKGNRNGWCSPAQGTGVMGALCVQMLHSTGDELHTKKFKAKTSLPSKLHPEVLIPSHPTALSHVIAQCQVQLALAEALSVLSRLPLLENPNL